MSRSASLIVQPASINLSNSSRITDEEDELMKTANPYPETKQDILFQKQVDFWKNKIDQILISPFNYNIWGAI